MTDKPVGIRAADNRLCPAHVVWFGRWLKGVEYVNAEVDDDAARLSASEPVPGRVVRVEYRGEILRHSAATDGPFVLSVMQLQTGWLLIRVEKVGEK